MPARPSSTPARFVQGAPVPHVQDVNATAALHRDVLGFTWDFGADACAVAWRDVNGVEIVFGQDIDAE